MPQIGASGACQECGAPLASGKECRDYFHDLLALEVAVPGGAGEEPHFFAVASYNLQHPSGFMPAALTGLRVTLADVLAGRANIAEARRRARTTFDGPARVRRRVDATLSADDLLTLGAWPTQWPMTVRDVCVVEPVRYADRVRAWATSVLGTLGTAAEA